VRAVPEADTADQGDGAERLEVRADQVDVRVVFDLELDDLGL
jgi:hypothetical protein